MADTWGRRFYTAGAILLLLCGCVHSISLFEKPVPRNATEAQLQDLMTNYKFDVMGSVRSMDNFLRGFSISFMLAALAIGALALVVRRERAGLLKRIALVISMWLALMTAVSLTYFFAAPTSFLAATLILFALAWMKLPAQG